MAFTRQIIVGGVAIDAAAQCIRLNPGNIGGPEKGAEAYEDPIEVAVLGCAVNGIGEASHADTGVSDITPTHDAGGCDACAS